MRIFTLENPFGYRGVTMPSFLSLFQGAYNRDPRPTRCAKLARTHGEVTICAAGGEKDAVNDGMLFLPLGVRSKELSQKVARMATLVARNYEKDIWHKPVKQAFNALQYKKFDCIFCHDLTLLPLGAALKNLPQNCNRCKLIMDAREFYPRQFENNIAWRLFLGGLNHYLCKSYMPLADHIFTVSPGLKRDYQKTYGLSTELLPSFPYFHELKPAPAKSFPIHCIHHGAASPGRKLELMIEAIKLLKGRFHLDMMLMPNNIRYLSKLKEMAAGIPYISFPEPVPMSNIVKFASAYDIGIYLLSPNSLNQRYALPNKFFEFIQARLAVAVGPSPDMASIVKKHNIGVVSEDFSPQSFASALNSLSIADINNYKANADKLAYDMCWENNEKILNSTILA